MDLRPPTHLTIIAILLFLAPYGAAVPGVDAVDLTLDATVDAAPDVPPTPDAPVAHDTVPVVAPWPDTQPREVVVPLASGLLVTRHHVVIDIARAATARGTPIPVEAFEVNVPRYVAVDTVGLDAESRRIVDEAGVEPVRTDRRPGEVATEATTVAPAPTLEAAAVAVLLVAGLATQAAFHGVVAMYHRIGSAKALENDTRRRVHTEVTRRGAAGIADVADALDVHPKTVKYHLDLLVKFQLLVRDGDGAYRPPGVRRVPDAPLEETILELVETRPGINMTEVARALDMSKSTAQQKVTALLVDGRLESRRASRARLLYPAAGA